MTRPLVSLIAIVVLCSIAAAQVIDVPRPRVSPATQPVAPETKEAFDARMAWWREARFGMFIHFGLYSVAAGEWNGVKTKGAGEWIMNDMKIPPGEYTRLVGRFNPSSFDAQKWVRLARTAGMKYIVITTKHHDGFCLFDSKFTDYDVMSSPFKRDIMLELSDAARGSGLKICWYYSIMDWHDPDAQAEQSFPTYEWRMRAQINELLTHYGDVGVMWFDGEWINQWNDDRGKNLYKLCRALQPGVIVNNRVGKHRGGMEGFTRTGGFAGDYATPEQQIPDTVPREVADWETCMTLNGTWGFKRDDVSWKSTTTIIRDLIDIASKNGNFLLNVGPTGDGDIPDVCVDRLQRVGEWMALNGESVYGTTGSPFDTKLPFGKCTQKPGKLYLHVTNWPENKTIVVPITNAASKAYLLAEPDPPLEFARGPRGIVIRVPEQMPNEDATVIALEIDGPVRGVDDDLAPVTTAPTGTTKPIATTMPAAK